MNMPVANAGRDLQGGLQITHNTASDQSIMSFFARGDVGKHREEIYARRMAREASMGPGNLYNKAMALYTEGKYWDAMFIFGRIANEYPDFFKNDFVHLYLGLCEEGLDMRGVATVGLASTAATFNRSVVAPMADLGLMRIAYRNGEHSKVFELLSTISGSGASDSLKYCAYYVAGQSYIATNDPAKAVQYLSILPVNHPDYIFAHHSLGVAYAMAGQMEKAKEAFDITIQTLPAPNVVSTMDLAHKEIIYRTYMMLGLIYYQNIGTEEHAASKAVTALRMVPKESYYYEDALLGIAWTALRVNQWND